MKIKQLVCFTLAVLIFGTRVGYALNVHYCGDHIAEVSLAFISYNCEMESHQNSKISFKTSLIVTGILDAILIASKSSVVSNTFNKLGANMCICLFWSCNLLSYSILDTY